MVYFLLDCLIGWLVNWLFSWLICWLLDLLVVWLVAIFAYWFIGLFIGWLVGWLIGWFSYMSTLVLFKTQSFFKKLYSFKWQFLFNDNNHLLACSYMVSSIPILYQKFPKESIWPIDGTLTDTTSSDQSRPGKNTNEEVLHTP